MYKLTHEGDDYFFHSSFNLVDKLVELTDVKTVTRTAAVILTYLEPGTEVKLGSTSVEVLNISD